MIEHRNWTYEDFPEFTEEIEGAVRIPTTGDESDIRYMHDVEYADIDGTKLHLQILFPASRNDSKREGGSFRFREGSELPCFVFVQGSGWFKQYVYANLPALVRLSRRGFVCAIVEYRPSTTATIPAQAQDTRNAIRFLRANAAKFRIDPDKIILAGDSSGGHTAMFAALLAEEADRNLYPGVSAAVKGIVDYYGSCSVMRWDGNPSTLNHHLPDSPEGVLMGGANLRERDDLCRRMSVECNITPETDLPPVLIFHGTKDRTVNCWESVDLYRRLKECGKETALYLVEGADHGGPEFWTEPMLDIVEAFIRKCLA